MGAVKAWMMDMESLTAEAVERGAVTPEDAVAYVRTHLKTVDDTFVKEQFLFMTGLDQPDESTRP